MLLILDVIIEFVIRSIINRFTRSDALDTSLKETLRIYFAIAVDIILQRSVHATISNTLQRGR